MSQITTLNAINNAMSDKVRCFSITGGWGEGKSYLIEKALPSDTLNVIEISLFGIESADELKKTIATDLFLKKAGGSNKLGYFKRICSILREKVLGSNSELSKLAIERAKRFMNEKFNKLLTPTTETIGSLLSADDILLFEDIERASKIHMPSFLGIVEDLRKKTNSTLILVLNDKELDKENKKYWGAFREKILDREIPLKCESVESAGIASQSLLSRYQPYFIECAEAFGLANIRILNKISEDIHNIVKLIPESIDDGLIQNCIKGAFIFSGLHWNANKLFSKVDIKEFFVVVERLAYGPISDSDEKLPDDQEEWNTILKSLNFTFLSDFERKFTAQYFRCGYLCEDELKSFFAKNESLYKINAQHDKLYTYLDKFYWDRTISSKELKVLAQSLINEVYLLSPKEATRFIKHIEDVYTKTMAQSARIRWVRNSEKHCQNVDDDLEDYRDNIDPVIYDVLEAALIQRNSEWTLMRSVLEVGRSNGWSKHVTNVIAKASARDFVEAIKSVPPADLRKFMLTMHKYHQKESYQPFENSVKNFRLAVNQIRKEKSRLGQIIRRIYPKDI